MYVYIDMAGSLPQVIDEIQWPAQQVNYTFPTTSGQVTLITDEMTSKPIMCAAWPALSPAFLSTPGHVGDGGCYFLGGQHPMARPSSIYLPNAAIFSAQDTVFTWDSYDRIRNVAREFRRQEVLVIEGVIKSKYVMGMLNTHYLITSHCLLAYLY